MKKESPVWSKLKSLTTSRSGNRAQRYDIGVRIMVESEDLTTKLECRSLNISRTGMFIEYSGFFWPNWILGLHLHLSIDPDHKFFNEVLKTRAKIMRVLIDNQENRNQVRFAVRFTE